MGQINFNRHPSHRIDDVYRTISSELLFLCRKYVYSQQRDESIPFDGHVSCFRMWSTFWVLLDSFYRLDTWLWAHWQWIERLLI